MTDRTKELIIKSLLVIAIILMIIVCPGGFFLHYLLPQEIGYTIYCYIFGALMLDSFLVMISFPILGKYIKTKPVKAEKFSLSFKDFVEFLNFFDKESSKHNYENFNSVVLENNTTITMYVRTKKINLLESVVIVSTSELKEDLLDIIDENISKFIVEYYENDIITDNINMICVICVDRITPTFQKYVNSNIEQEYKKGKLPVGISFGGRNIYIAKQIGGFGVLTYKNLRRHFLQMMGINTSKS